jgi:hypothetical protein
LKFVVWQRKRTIWGRRGHWMVFVRHMFDLQEVMIGDADKTAYLRVFLREAIENSKFQGPSSKEIPMIKPRRNAGGTFWAWTGKLFAAVRLRRLRRGGLTGLRVLLWSVTRACARGARYSPGCHIAGFQPCRLSAFRRALALCMAKERAGYGDRRSGGASPWRWSAAEGGGWV